MASLWSGTGPSLVLAGNPAIQFMVYEAIKKFLMDDSKKVLFNYTIHNRGSLVVIQDCAPCILILSSVLVVYLQITGTFNNNPTEKVVMLLQFCEMYVRKND